MGIASLDIIGQKQLLLYLTTQFQVLKLELSVKIQQNFDYIKQLELGLEFLNIA